MKAQLKVSHDVRHKVFLEIIGMLWGHNDAGLKDLADAAGCHWVTLYAWRSGRTTAPRLDKIAGVALALGYEITLLRRKRPTLRAVK